MQSWKKSALAALLLLVVLAGCLFASEPEEDEGGLILKEPPAKTEERRPAHQAIAGSEQAAASKGLKDPFTLMHETREEKSKAAEKKNAAQAAKPEQSPALPMLPKPAPAAKPPVVQEPKLTGIISGLMILCIVLAWMMPMQTQAVSQKRKAMKAYKKYLSQTIVEKINGKNQKRFLYG